LVQPPVNRQWPILAGGTTNAGGIGNDYAVRQVGSNSSGQLPAQLYGYYQLATTIPQAGATMRVTGYGSTTSAQSQSAWNAVNKTHTGPFTSASTYRLDYIVDTTGGNSGSPIIIESTGEAIGIHTNGGCSSTGGTNIGTFLARPQVQVALASICPPANQLTLTLSSSAPGALTLAITNIPAGSTEGFSLFSLNTTLPAGQGTLLGLMPDILTLSSLGLPAVSGSLFHFLVPSLPTHFPSVPFQFPAGTFNGFGGISIDARAILIQGSMNYELTNLVRWTF
jgi:hypothetical protein